MPYDPLQIQRYLAGGFVNVSPYTDMEYVTGLADALGLKVNSALIGAASGVAPLDTNTKLPIAYFPDVIIDGMDRKGSIVLTGSAVFFDAVLTANPTMAHGTAHKGDYWSITHASANTTITITENDLMDDSFQDPTTGAFGATAISANPGDWIIFEGYFQDEDLTSRYHWSILNNNAANLYSPIGHGHTLADISGITAEKVLVSNVAGVPVASTITITELDYLNDATGNIQTQINGKEPTIAAAPTDPTLKYWRGDKSWQTLNKAAVGLTNADDTADANKAVASAGKWTTGRLISLTGVVTGSATIDGSAAASINTSVQIAAAGNYYGANTGLTTVLAALDTELFARPEIQIGTAFSGTPRVGDILFKTAA